MTIRPLHDLVLLQRVAATDKTPGGIIIPDSVQERPHEGIVLAVGPGRVLANGRRLEPNVKTGDRVLYGKYASGTATASSTEDRDPPFLVRESEIHLVIGGGT